MMPEIFVDGKEDQENDGGVKDSWDVEGLILHLISKAPGYIAVGVNSKVSQDKEIAYKGKGANCYCSIYGTGASAMDCTYKTS